MIEQVLAKKFESVKIRISIKIGISALIIALAVGLPQIVHLILGQAGGIEYLPMYLPVLLGGCLLGLTWGLGIGVLSPLISFGITYLAGNPMPVLARLPFMVIELGVWGLMAGLWCKMIVKNGWAAFPAVITSAVVGRLAFLFCVFIAQSFGWSSLTVDLIWEQIKTGLLGLVIQAVLVPFIIVGLRHLLLKEKSQEND